MKKLQRMANSMRESTIFVVECCRKDTAFVVECCLKDTARAFSIAVISIVLVYAAPQLDKNRGEYLGAKAAHLLTCYGLFSLVFKIPSENKSTEKNPGNLSLSYLSGQG